LQRRRWQARKSATRYRSPLEDLPLAGLLADNVYQDLVGVQDPEERKRRIIAAAERQSQAAPPPPRPFIGVPPNNNGGLYRLF
jgi:hypothetical protein